MAKTHTVSFDSATTPVEVLTGSTITEAANLAGIEIHQPCGGQGRCGRCVIKVQDGKVRRRSSLTAGKVTVPDDYQPDLHQTIKRIPLTIEHPSMEDQTNDWSRLQRSIKSEAGIENLQISLTLLQQIGGVLREGDWEVTVVLEVPSILVRPQ